MKMLSGEEASLTKEAISTPPPLTVYVSEVIGEADGPHERPLTPFGTKQAQPPRLAHQLRPIHGSSLVQMTATNKQQRKERTSRMPKPTRITGPFADIETPDSMRKTKFPDSSTYVAGPSRGRNNFRKRCRIATSMLSCKPGCVDIHSESSRFLPATANAKSPPVLASQTERLGPVPQLMYTTSLELVPEPPPMVANQCGLDMESFPDLANASGPDTVSAPSVLPGESSCSTTTLLKDHEQKVVSSIPCLGLFRAHTDQSPIIISQDLGQRPRSPALPSRLFEVNVDQSSILIPMDHEQELSSSSQRMGLLKVCSYPSVQTLPNNHVQNRIPSNSRMGLFKKSKDWDSSIMPKDHESRRSSSFAHSGLSANSTDQSGIHTISAYTFSSQESPCSTVSTPSNHAPEPISYAPNSKLSIIRLDRSANRISQSSVVAGSLPPTLPPSVEEAYKKKCIELKRRLQEVEETNDSFRLRKIRLMRGIRKMRLERAFLLETLGKRMKKNGSGINGMQGFYDEDSEGSSEGPPTVCNRGPTAGLP